ncbi:MAG: LysR family transcriptional regulator, partial [Clostridium sp.]
MKYVYTVYEEKSFSKAAKKLYVTQPALSHMVRKAEEEVGALIFDRSTIPLTVTQEGMYYIKSVEEILFIQRNLKAYFKDLNELNAGSLSIGGSSFFCSFVLAEIIGRFKNKYPNVTIDLREGNIKELKKELEEETLDLVMETALSSDDITI